MSITNYFPTSEASRIIWLTNFSTKLQAHATVLALNPPELALTLTDITYYVWLIQTWYPGIQQSAFEATAYKNLIANGSNSPLCALPIHAAITPPTPIPVPGVLTRLANLVARIKIGTGYTESIGLDLGVIGTEDVSEHLTPDYTVSTERGEHIEQANISFTKYRHDGVYIEGRRNQGDWEFLGVAMVKPWLDTRPLLALLSPEIREYRLRWWDKGAANGELSAVQRVTVGP